MAGEDDGHALPRGVAGLLLAHEEVQVLRQARHERRAWRDAVAVERLALRLRLAAPLRRCARLGGVARAAEAAATLLVHLRAARAVSMVSLQRRETARALARGATPSIAMYSIFSGCIICVASVTRASGERQRASVAREGAQLWRGRPRKRAVARLHKVVQVTKDLDHHLVLRESRQQRLCQLGGLGLGTASSPAAAR